MFSGPPQHSQPEHTPQQGQTACRSPQDFGLNIVSSEKLIFPTIPKLFRIEATHPPLPCYQGKQQSHIGRHPKLYWSSPTPIQAIPNPRPVFWSS